MTEFWHHSPQWATMPHRPALVEPGTQTRAVDYYRGVAEWIRSKHAKSAMGRLYEHLDSGTLHGPVLSFPRDLERIR